MRIKLLESKEDIQRFIDKFGQDIYDRLQRNKQRILNKTKDPKTVDITWLVKNASLEDVEKMLSSAESVRLDIEGRPIPKPTHTKELVYNKNGVKVYKVYDMEDMIDIGRDTGWCIAGKYDTEDTKVSQAKQYFNSYKNELNLECYYVFVKGNDKYCVLLLPNGNKSIWNKQDNEIDSKMFASTIGEAAEVIGLKDLSKEVYIWNGKSEVPDDVVNVKIADGVTSIGDGAFLACTLLKSIVIPDSVTSIVYGAFSGCCSLTNINIPSSVTRIGNYAFQDCNSLTSIIIPSSVTSIGAYAFYGCNSLIRIAIPDSVKRIGSNTFRYCYDLTSVSIPSSVTSIGESAFLWCSSLKRITIPNSVTSIGDNAFSCCKSLKSITIPDSVTSIEYGVFRKCISLTSVTIPNSVTYIGYGAFYDCDNLTDVYYTGTKEQWESIDVGDGNDNLRDVNIHFNS